MRMKQLWLALLLVVLFLPGCVGRNTAESVPVDENSALPPYDGPSPAAGTGNVYGQVKWNGAGVAGLDVALCADYSSFSGCNGREYKEKTAVDGTFLFTSVEPGDYALSVRVFDTDDWLYVGSGVLSSYDFAVEAGGTVEVEPQHIFKLDITPVAPANQAEVVAGELTLSWEPYPDAAYYRIYLTPEEGDAIFIDDRVDGTQIGARLLPLNCNYRWSLEAFNREDIKIAETLDASHFSVQGADTSCHLQIQAPAAGAEIDGNGVVLNWDPHPLAASYKLLLWNDTDPDRENVLDFVSVVESSYAFDEPLAPARYVWTVTAYDEIGNEIAGSEVVNFTVVD